MFQAQAKQLVFEYVKHHLETTNSSVSITKDDVYIVWFSKFLDNWKALLSTTLPDDMYYELMHDGFKHETRIEAYMKVEDIIIPDPPPAFDPTLAE